MAAKYIDLDEMSELIENGELVTEPAKAGLLIWQLDDGALAILARGQDQAVEMIPDRQLALADNDDHSALLEQLAQDHPSIELGLIIDRGIEDNRVESAQQELLERGVDPALVDRLDWSWEGLERRLEAA